MDLQTIFDMDVGDTAPLKFYKMVVQMLCK